MAAHLKRWRLPGLILVVFAIGYFFIRTADIKRESLTELQSKLEPLQKRAEEMDGQAEDGDGLGRREANQKRGAHALERVSQARGEDPASNQRRQQVFCPPGSEQAPDDARPGSRPTPGGGQKREHPRVDANGGDHRDVNGCDDSPNRTFLVAHFRPETYNGTKSPGAAAR